MMWAQHIIYWLLLLSSLCAGAHGTLCAQTHNYGPLYTPPSKLNLQEAIALSLRMNPQVQVANIQRIIDKYALVVARNEFEPRYTFKVNGEYSRSEKPVYTNNIGTQVKLPTGTQFQFDVSNVYGIDQTNRLTYSIRQPLLRGAGCAVNLAGLRNSYDSEKINRLNLKETTMATITSVISAFNRIILDEQAVEINQQALKDAEQTLSATQLQIKAGRRAGTVITQQLTQVAQLRLVINRGLNAVAQDKRALLVLLGLDPKANIDIDTRGAIRQVTIPNKNTSIKQALRFNTAYQSAVIGLRQTYRNVIVAKNQQLWDLNITAAGTKDLGEKRSLANDHRITLGLDVPIDDKPRKQQYINATVGFQQAMIRLDDNKRQLINAVMNSLNNLEAQRKQINIAKDSVHYAEKSLEIALKKYKYGRSSIFEVTSLRQTLTVSRQTLLGEQIAYVDTFAEFERLLGVTLDRWRVRLVY